ncbi:tRNA (adenosine(37)-N6)-threonylcarbamoyltransferase complex dimerization subunit type 1 TsaB [Candidatus Fukatsuia anoeciicola]|uniref:tRNA (adenosine(37)-N6)-threonylcarbamoyltransferase complex dimerization subunit type 1 TsaB n=1 Tax=Candidatus Fukatsuia anoeciicola TaxID=2994492 RepID=UPI003464BF7A
MSVRILAIDTTTEACSVAIWNNGEICTLFKVCPRKHTRYILPMIQKILADSGLSLHQLDALAFGRGPGSFTGVRIGISIGQGLALGANLPMISVSTLQTLAQGGWRQSGVQQVLVAIDARMGEIYWGQFTQNTSGYWLGIDSEAVITPKQASIYLQSLVGHWVTVGTGWQIYPDLITNSKAILLTGQVILSQAEDMLPLALQSWYNGDIIKVEQAEPIYLRNKAIWKKIK